MANFDDVVKVTIPNFSDEQLDAILENHSVDEVMKALGYEKKLDFSNITASLEQSSEKYVFMNDYKHRNVNQQKVYGVAA
ncbi:hypothetical protein FFRU_270060 [Fructobacillus fructosus]|uniref:hypothetical protein n=1 Tax=Fructobacillus fructosus TaxID=1631 RepID=UPI0002195DA2|nr:hypothetical protein [Fructobacillus fructosus]KRN51948.1 hypothetical protein IV71_GL000399 [Fructobacillus fructosus KCTC 3544]GAP02035.1 hypothetical protein FFRU_270060 [Fructobacillus fructosus]